MGESVNGVERITAQALEAGLRRGDRLTVLDVRRREAWATDPARVPGSVWLPLEEVPQRARNLPAETHLVVYCS